MRSALLFPVLLSLAACNSAKPVEPAAVAGVPGAIVEPVSRVENGITILEHDATAISRAPRFTIDSGPFVVLSGGEKGAFDLSHADQPVRLADGHFLVVSGPNVMLFNADGSPLRMLGVPGKGPGDFMRPARPVLVGEDTVIILDEGNERMNWVTVAGGVVRQARIKVTPEFFCLSPIGIRDKSLITMPKCLDESPDTIRRNPVRVLSSGLGYESMHSILTVPGFEMVLFETNYGGQKRMSKVMLELGQWSDVALWDSAIVAATGVGGFTLDRYNLSGTRLDQIKVNTPRQPVTQKMKDVLIKLHLDRLNQGNGESEADPKENRRLIREAPFADSLPPYGRMVVATDGILWVQDTSAPGDATWGATGFRKDGAIIGHVSGGGGAIPVWFGDHQVMLREVDADGVVRFAIYSM